MAGLIGVLNARWGGALVDELVKSGVRDAVVCPGSRSSPLAIGCAEAPGLRTWSLIDERTAGFFALGLARETGRPVAVVVTSGSAGAHLLPAAIEAWASHVPLIALTANRPWELHGFGAPQTIPQEGLFGRFARSTASLGLPEATSAAFAHLRALTARLAALAQGPGGGPVHLDVPFREPLVPEAGAPALEGIEPEALEGRPGVPFLKIPASVRRAAPEALEAVRRRLASAERGVVVVGPCPPNARLARAVHALAASYGLPVLAEVASNLRSWPGPRTVAHADLLLRNASFAARIGPEIVLWLGGGGTSKRIGTWLQESRAEVVLLGEHGEVVDPTHRAATFLEGDPAAACEALAAGDGKGQRGWAAAFLDADARAAAFLEREFRQATELTEPLVAHAVWASLPPDAKLVVASSMPIRDLDAYAPASSRRARVFSNRGVNGIDGTISTAFGVAAGSPGPTWALVGDLAFLHDVGGLLIGRRSALPLTVVVVNNDGGGIFSFLPVARSGTHFERLFGTPHGLDLSHAAALYGARFVRASTPAQLRDALAEQSEGQFRIIEARVPDRARNVAVHEALGARVAAALEPLA